MSEQPIELSEDRLVWIMGSSRSGSTWLLRMLAELDGAVPIDDPHIGHHLGVWRPIPLAWAAGKEEPELTTLDEVKADRESYLFSGEYEETWRPLLGRLILGRFAAQAGDRTGPVFVKEPGSQAAELILSLFGRSHLVFLLRDGRDVVDSWLSAYQEDSWAQQEGAFPLAAEGRESFIRWQASVWSYRTQAVSRAFARHDPARRVLVRYEDLREDPVRELGRICEAIGKAPDFERIATIAEAHDFDRVPTWDKGDAEEIRAASPGGWRQNLSPAEQRVMTEALGDTLISFGYPIHGDEPAVVTR